MFTTRALSNFTKIKRSLKVKQINVVLNAMELSFSIQLKII